MFRSLSKFILLIFPLLLLFFPSISLAALVNKAPSALGLVGYWNLNEGQGNKVNDSSGNYSPGTLSGATPPSWTTGKFGKALSFDGASSYVDTNVDYSWSLTDSFSMSAWVKSTEGAGNLDSIVSKVNWEYTFYKVGTTIGFNYWNTAGSNVITMSGTIPNDGAWHFATVTYDGTVTTGNLYIDGVLAATDNSNAGTLQNRTETTKIGEGYAWGQGDGFMNGSIDEVRIYNRVLSQSDVTELYRSTQLTHKAPSNNGLVVHLAFDEGRGNKTNDLSGTGNTGSITGSASWVQGKYGKALSFENSASDMVTLSYNSTLDLSSYTFSAWVNRSGSPTSQARIISKIDRYLIYTGTNNIPLCYNQALSPLQLSASGALPLNTWVHIACTFSGGSRKLYINGSLDNSDNPTGSVGTDGNSVTIGNYNGSDSYRFRGKIDDMRIYNRALSASEIQKLYSSTSIKLGANQASQLTSGLVGYWSMNGPDVAGTTVYDRSGQGNNGTISSGNFDGGKIGQAISLNGSTDYISIPAASSSVLNITGNQLTQTAWIYPKANVANGTIFTRNGAYYFQRHSDGKLAAYQYGTTPAGYHYSNDVVPLNQWSFVAVTYDGANLIFYINGVATGGVGKVGNVTQLPGYENQPLRIGWDSSAGARFFNGLIDEPRLYNRALSAKEVQLLYNLGK